VVAASDYRRKWASYELLRQKKREKGEIKRGIGIALGYQGSGLLHSSTGSGSCGIEMTLEKDGTLEIKTSMISSGSDYVNVWGGIASDILAVDKGMVRIHCNTGSPDSGPSTMSRNVSVFTRLIEQACIAIRKQRFRKPLPITVRKKMRPQKNSAWEECFPGKTHSPPDYSGFERPGWASAVVEIEIDPVEFIPRIRGVWMTVDGGKIVSEAHARRVLSASVIQALGWSYLEQLGYVDGIIPPEQYDNFDIPDPVQIPKIEIGFVESGSVDPRGIGDLPFNCVPAAFLQAVSQALDRQLDSIPLKAQDIWEAGKKA
ncbi:MAG: molybdopterin-dependent oxidoreductase, partial [Treponema sp.]|nr:molybdopterin-dependent oxidoreductase [Treponema sp.]